MKKYLIEFFFLMVFAISLILLLTNSLWYDEQCTVPLIMGYDLKGIIAELRYDAHPPVYFLLLKVYTLIFGDSIMVMKSFNIPISLLLVFSVYTFCRKTIDRRFALIAVAILCFMPAIYNEVFQIRMYVLASLFVTLTAIYSYRVYFNPEKVAYSVLMMTFSLLSIYTHYYALVGVVVIHLCLYIGLIVKSKKYIKQSILYASICILSFLPWLSTFLFQLRIKKENLGDPSSIMDRIMKNLTYPFYTGNYAVRDEKLNFVLTILLLAIVLLIFVIYLRTPKAKLKREKYNSIMLISILIPISIVTCFTIISILIDPIWYSRYFFIFFPIFIYGFAYIVHNEGKKLRSVFFIVLGICFIQKMYSEYEITSDKGLENYQNLLGKVIYPNDVILDGDKCTSTYFPDIDQFGLRIREAHNWDRHIYWNVKLVNDYVSAIGQRTYFWSTSLRQDSLYVVGKRMYKLSEKIEYSYVYYSKGKVGLYKYSYIKDIPCTTK